MNDLISRQAAIDMIEKYFDGLPIAVHHDMLAMIHRLPSAQPERCEECKNFSKTRLLIPQPESIRCKDCERYDAHNHRCKWWNHGVSNIDWCSYAEPYKGEK